MRTIQTFVLTLLIDSEEFDALRGSLHSIANEAEYPFVDARGLLELLEQLIVRPTETRLTASDGPVNRIQATPANGGQNPDGLGQCNDYPTRPQSG